MHRVSPTEKHNFLCVLQQELKWDFVGMWQLLIQQSIFGGHHKQQQEQQQNFFKMNSRETQWMTNRERILVFFFDVDSLTKIALKPDEIEIYTSVMKSSIDI